MSVTRRSSKMAAVGLSFTACPTLNASGTFVLAYSLLHVSGEERSGEYQLPSANSKPQAIGSAITYARRYAFCSVVGVVPEEDDDGTAAQQAKSGGSGGKQKQKQPQAQPARANEANPETGEIPEPPNVSAAIEKLDQEGRKELQAKLDKANYPALDQLAPAAAKTVLKWAQEIQEAREKGAPFS